MGDWVIRLIEQSGYLGVGFLMFLETIFPPIPSEVIMPVAGVAAARGDMALGGVIAAGTSGAMLGNTVWYLVAAAPRGGNHARSRRRGGTRRHGIGRSHCGRNIGRNAGQHCLVPRRPRARHYPAKAADPSLWPLDHHELGGSGAGRALVP